MAAGVAVLNGAGELTGSIEIREWGILETPIVLTATNAVGRGYDGVVDALFAAGEIGVVIPVVGECDDSWLDDIARRWVTTADVRDALDDAVGGPVAEGAVGAGTGMITMGHKAGIGTSSRVVGDLGTVGVLCSPTSVAPPTCASAACPSGRPSSPNATDGADARQRRLVHRHRGDRHPARRQTARTCRPPGRSRSRPCRVGRPRRQRRDLLRVLDRQPAAARRRA